MLFKNSIISKVNKIRSKADANGEYTLFNSDLARRVFVSEKDKEVMKDFFELFSEWDNAKGVIPLELGTYVEELIKNPELCVGIHRTNIAGNVYDSAILYGICREGLRNNGDLSSGIYTDKPHPGKTVSFVNKMLNFVIQLKSSYKGSSGCVLVTIPSEYMDGIDGDMKYEYFDDIYTDINGIPTIKPEYIIGYLEAVDGKYQLYTREEILEKNKSTTL